MTPALEASSLVKRFGAVTALSEGRLRVEPGEIHALLGANGCGKSTLCKIVAGVVAPDGGVLRVAGQDVRMRHPRDAEALGIALFFQELSLVGQLTVAENLCLGREPVRPGGFTDRRAMRAQALALAAQFGPGVAARLQPDTPVAALPPDLRQVVEVLKVLARRPRLMILDEATAALDAEQARTLFAILRARKAEGVSTIMISHRLDEVFAVADRITVMRNGATVAELDRAGATPDEVVRHMVGAKGPLARQDAPAGSALAGPPLLEGEGLSGRGLRGVSFALAPGEVVGLGGLQGQGQSALLQGLFGALPLAGQVRLAGAPLRLARPADAIRAGLAYVSGDRGRDAGLHGRSIFENLVAARLVRDGRWAVFPRALAPEAAASAAALRTKYGRLTDAIGTLSGGNQQKVFIARWLATNPRVLLLDDPTKGIDLGAKADLFALVRGLAGAGAAVLLHSSDDAELLGQCSRILVFNGGRVSAELAGDRRDAFHLTRAAYGEAA